MKSGTVSADLKFPLIDKAATAAPPAPASSDLLSYSRAALRLAVSLNHLRNLIDSGYLRSVKVGVRGRRVRSEDVDKIAREGIDVGRSKSPK